jgi:outer membrane protein assembly factor BamB
MIEGSVTVTSGEDAVGLPNVCVSNGREVVQTDSDGRFALDQRPEDRFVFVTVPSGYEVQGSFFRRIGEGENYNFSLRPNAASDATEFSFVQITDIHMSVDGGRSSDLQLREDLDKIYDDVGDRAAFIVATGDLTNRATEEEFEAYLRGIEVCKLPLLNCIGNHDDNDTEAQGEHYQNAIGPTYYSFEYGHIHFIVYDCVGKEWRDPDHQEDWVQADLATIPPGSPVVMLIHYPLGDRFYDQFRDHNIIATFSGHWHCARIFEDSGTIHYNTPTFCFGGIDQSPRAYRFCTVQDGKLTSEIRTLDARPFCGASFRPASEDPDVSVAAAAQPRPDANWPLFRGSPARTGQSTANPELPFSPAWKASSGAGLHQGSAILVDDCLIVGTQNEDRPNASGLVALDAATGTRRWEHTTASSIKLSPGSANGRIFAATVTGEVVALGEAGGHHWSYQLGNASERWVYSCPLAWKNRVYVGAAPHFVALNEASGEVDWLRDDIGHQDWIASYPSPAGYEDFLTVSFHGQPVNLMVLEADTGKTVWNLEEAKTSRTNTTPVIDAEGTIYIVGGTTHVRAFEISTGEVKWETLLEKTRCAASPSLSDGRLFVPDGSGRLSALDTTTGEVSWTWQSGDGLGSFSPYVRGGKGALSSPVVTERYVFLGSADGHLYGIDVNSGETAWSHDLGVPTLSSPVVSGNGLWTGSCDGMIHSFVSAG